MQSVKQWAGKTVLLRIDGNGPMDKKCITDDSRLRAVVPTVQWLCKQKARVVIVSHLGRPGGKRVASLSLKPVAAALAKLTRKKISCVSAKIGSPTLSKTIASMRNGQVVMLENIRFYPGENASNPEFTQALADIADVFVSDCFAVVHRNTASIVGVAKHLPAYAGLLVQEELAAVSKVHRPKSPAVLIIGGVKIETKLPVIRKLLPYFDAVLVSGGVFNTMLAAKGYGVGASRHDMTFAKEARWLWKQKKVYTPVDVTVGTTSGTRLRHVPIPKKKGSLAEATTQLLDVGPATIMLFQEILATAKTIVWNGPLGYTECEAYRLGVDGVAAAIAQQTQRGAFALIGGGETVEALHRNSLVQYNTHISTGGGALLHALSGQTLPGIAVLES